MADKGIIACFDILGYQNIIDTNQIEYVAELISKKISKLPAEAISKLEAGLERYKGKVLDDETKRKFIEVMISLKENIQYLSISDTIIASLKFEHDLSSNIGFLYWLIFLAQMAILQRTAFSAGLPMRGAIDFGQFYIHENIFAGKPIIDSFRLAQDINFSGCALTSSAGNRLLEITRDLSEKNSMDLFIVLKDILTPYLAPLKRNNYQRLLLINWLFVNLTSEELPQRFDLRQYVNTAFHDHNKEIDETVIPKIENTERILRWMKEKKWKLDENCIKQ